MKTAFREENGDYVMYFDGRLDTASTMQVEKDMEPLNDCSDHDIILDCTRLEYICSSGLRIFLGILKNAKLKNSRVFIRGLNSKLKSVFDMTGFTKLFMMK